MRTPRHSPLCLRPLGRRVFLTARSLLLAGCASAGLGLPAQEVKGRNLGDLSIEELMNESVTSVSKKATPLHESPAAITVITPEDIRRLGIGSLPEALRLVPGVDVARVGANETAVSVRGLNSLYANKLLVMIDGRAVYSPTSAGVFWNAQDVVLEDLDRIEVIRGPGATVWGANAVNGVINIITKSARETQGTLVATAVGTEERPTTTVRYGGQLAPHLYYRVYAKYFDRSSLTTRAGDDALDGWNSFRTGFRTDYEPSDDDTLTVQADYYLTDARKTQSLVSLAPPYSETMSILAKNRGHNVLGRWRHRRSATSQLTVQAYYDHIAQDFGATISRADTVDLDLEYQLALGARHETSWGASYRDAATMDTSSFNASWAHNRHRLRKLAVFSQDDISLVPDRLHFIIGSKVEHNELTGLEWEPAGRLLWTPATRQTVWAAVSRAVRTPSFLERDTRLNLTSGPGFLFTIFGNPDLKSEKLTAYEAGYRVAPVKQLSFEAAAFYNVYDDMVGNQPNPPTFETSPSPPHLLLSDTWRNTSHGETYGGELSIQWQVARSWRVTGSYSWLHTALAAAPLADGTSPLQQFQIRSNLDLPHHLELNAAVYHVGSIVTQNGPDLIAIPGYVRLDVGLVFHPRESVELGVWGTNLLDRRHLEFTSPQSQTIAEVSRGVTGRITWRF